MDTVDTGAGVDTSDVATGVVTCDVDCWLAVVPKVVPTVVLSGPLIIFWISFKSTTGTIGLLALLV